MPSCCCALTSACCLIRELTPALSWFCAASASLLSGTAARTATGSKAIIHDAYEIARALIVCPPGIDFPIDDIILAVYAQKVARFRYWLGCHHHRGRLRQCPDDRLVAAGFSRQVLRQLPQPAAEDRGADARPMDVEHVGDHAETWEKVVRKLNVGAMPPLGAPQPDKAAAGAFTSWLEASLDRAAAAKPNAGDPGLHRVNRTEYGNVIRDLLALDVDTVALLPADDPSYGFDNIASVLGVSPSLLERYVSAAGKISRLAVGDPDVTPIVDTYRIRTDFTQNEHIEGLPFGTRGGALIKHNFPVDGDYTIRVKLLTSTIDLLFGGNAADEYMEIDLNGEKVQTMLINPTKKAEAPAEAPAAERAGTRWRSGRPGGATGGRGEGSRGQRWRRKPPDFIEVTIPVKAGPQTVGVSFLQKTYAPTEDLIEPFLRSTYDSSDPKGLPHIFSVSIGGPFNIKDLAIRQAAARYLSASPLARAMNCRVRRRSFRPWRDVRGAAL